ncbi:MAG: SdrD B-like domain-containing protein, partial [Gammaproteobacteria bacterium]
MLFSNASSGQLRAFKVTVAMFLATFISSSSLVIAQSADKAIATDAGMVVTKLWEDLNRDGVQDLNEPGVSGVMVGLFTCDGAFIESRLSNDVGVIPFVASEGCYQLRYADIEGYRYCGTGSSGDVTNDSDVNPSTRTSAPFEITAGTYQINVDAGVMQIQNSEIGDRVWHDLNANGVQDFNEPGLGSVPISLLNCNGQAVRDLDGQALTAVSDAQGNFLFENLNNGCYLIETQLEEGQYLTDDYASTPQYDSDLDPVTLRSDAIQLQSAQGLHNVDVGVYQHGSIGDYVWLDTNRNGVQENGESGMSGVNVLLLDQNGSPTGINATTDGNGRYEFAELKPGEYRLQFVIPQNYVAAEKDQGDSDLLDNDGNSLGATANFTVLSAQTQTDIDFGVVQQQVIEIALEARTYGEDADSPAGPYVAVGDNVSWEYIVSNTGDLPLYNVIVEDDQGVFVSCPASVLEAGETFTCTSSANDAQAGQYTNLATVQATDSPEGSTLYTAQDRSHYFGADPSITLTILANGVDANAPGDLSVAAGETIIWQYRVTNTGNVPLDSVEVTDSNPDVTVSCPSTTIESGVEMTCTAAGIAVAGENSNTGTVTGSVPEEDPIIVTATDTSFYFGTASDLIIGLQTNGVEASAPPGPMIAVGETVTWTYSITNSGASIIMDAVVTDSEGANVTCPVQSLAPGQTITCTATGVAEEGQFSNSATWVGTIDGESTPLSNVAEGFYFGTSSMASVNFNVRTNGSDADSPAVAPQIAVGSSVTWSYEVENTGNVALTNIVIVDDQIGAITCPQTTVEPGESLNCTASSVAESGAYANTGTLTAETPDGQPVMAMDPSHYFGFEALIDIETLTNNEDSDTPPGVTLSVGDSVEWRYIVTNTGNVDLFGFTVTDSVLGSITCPTIDLLVGESVECVANGTVIEGQYANTGTACAPQNEEFICDEDMSHYFGGSSALTIQTRTNGSDADNPSSAPQINVGESVSWTYSVTNTGTVLLTDVVVADDQLGAVTCPSTSIEPGETLICSASGTAEAGAYTNLGSVTASDPQGTVLEGSDPSNYFGVLFELSIETLTNGIDADTPTGPIVPVGEPVEWSYVVTNLGNVGLFGFTVSDDILGDITCPVTDLAPGQSVTCTASGVATSGQYANVGTVCAPQNEELLCAEDPSHYLGGVSGITIQTRTNGSDADTQSIAPQIPVGQTVTWTYNVTNTGNTLLTDIVVTDDLLGPITCPVTEIPAGETIVCTATGTAEPGPYTNVGSVVGTDPQGATLDATDPSNYFGVIAAISIETLTNTIDADTPPGPTIPVGGDVQWTYIVTNDGNVDLFGFEVTDSVLGPITCPVSDIAAGQSIECFATGTATAGQYANTGSVCAPQGEELLCDEDPTHHFGGEGGIEIQKLTNGVDADVAPGVELTVGEAVTWTYVVTNTGDLPLTGLTVNDDQGVDVTCPVDSLEPGESTTCSGTGIATAGQYVNVGTACGQSGGDEVCDSDSSFYLGSSPSVLLEKLTNGVDADVAPGPSIGIGEAVSWTYVVTNNSSVAIGGITVTDDQGVVVTCPMETLAAGDSMTCTGSGIATAGQYTNLGSVTAQGLDANGNPVGAPVSADDPSNYFGATTGVSIEKFTNGVDATAAPGPSIAVGEAIEWTYVVTNTGNITLDAVVVTDDQGVVVTCPLTTLAAGQSMTCTGSGVATAGQYVNIGSVTGQGVEDNGEPIGPPQTDTDPSFYFGGSAAIGLEKFTNGVDATAAPGPSISVGDDVTWTYVATNLGNITLNGINVTDDQGVAVTCPMDTLAAGESMTCSGSGTATAGQYMNLGSVTGQGVDGNGDPVGAPQTDTDPSFYFGASTGVSIEKFTNGVDATAAPGPSIGLGETVEWTYVVTNLGNITLDGITVTDDQGVVVTCPLDALPGGQSMTCTGSGTATAGQYMNIGTVTGQGVDGNGEPVGGPQTDTDPSFYFGASTGISIEKFTNGIDVDAAPGPYLPISSDVEWTYVVTNLGNITLTDVVVTDDQGVTVTCPMATLAAGESMTCNASGITTVGQYTNVGSVTGQGVDGDGNPVGAPQTDADSSFYFGGVSKVNFEKYTNGQDADEPTGPSIAVGDAVEWTYEVFNDGNVTIANLSVSDDQGVIVTCPMDTLAPGESMTCVGSGVATAGQYANIGTLSGQGVDNNGNPFGVDIEASDPSHYFGVTSSIGIEKFTNGVDAAAAPGPSIAVGDAVEWTYVVTNLGNVSLADVNVTDDQGVSVSCPMDTLAVGESMTCTGSGTATAGQYMNLGTATGQGVDGDGNPVGGPQTGSDPSFYFGASSGIGIEKFTNGIDVTAAPGPSIAIGDSVEWTYVVTNLGNVALSGVSVADDQGVSVTCPMDTLAAGESMTCTGSGIATAGQYMNLGTATGQGVDGDGNPVGGPQSDSDPSFYFGANSGISIEKFTNGVDATSAPGPSVA